MAQFPILIFADGACSGNPGPGGWGAVIVTPAGEVLEMGGQSPKTTNNQMELTAVIESLRRIARQDGTVDVFTDSTYVIRGITQWIWGWQKRGWKTAEGKDVANAELWRELFALTMGRRTPARAIGWKYVRGHAGIPGNERVDEIAVLFSKNQRPSLYHGPLRDYGIAIHDIPEDCSLPAQKAPTSDERSKAGAQKKAADPPIYLSLVDGVLMRHASWPECEARIKGRSGARFKKTVSFEEENAVLKSWGLKT